MLIDRTHRAWAAGTAAAFTLSAAIYAAVAALSTGRWNGGSVAGLAFGIVGFATMLFAGLLSLRKKFPIWRIGRTQAWMRGHLWLGLLSLALILFHAGFVFGGALTRVLMWLFVVVVASGVVGAALQHYLPRAILARIPMETIYEQIPHVRQQLVAECDAVVAAACGALTVATDLAPAAGAAPAALATVVRIDAEESAPLRDFYLSEMRPFLERPDDPHPLADREQAARVFARLRMLLPPTFHEPIGVLENVCEEERELGRQRRLHRLLHGWLLVHAPLSFALLALALVHIVMALRY